MSDNARSIGVIGEGRAIRKLQESRAGVGGIDQPPAPPSPTSPPPPSPLERPSYGVNICIELFGGSRIHRPLAMHSPCCKRYEQLTRTEFTQPRSSGSPEATGGGVWTACDGDSTAGASCAAVSVCRSSGSSRGQPDGEAAVSDDFKQFMSKFKDLKVVWEERQPAERDAAEGTRCGREEKEREFGESFDKCSMNVKMFFMEYTMTKSEQGRGTQHKVRDS